MRRAAAIAGALAIAGCAQLTQFTAQDAATAAAIDPTHAACYQGFGEIATAIGATKPGILSAAAIDMRAHALFQDPNCAPVIITIAGQILKATPAAPLVP